MKKILFYTATALYCFRGIQAAENVDNEVTENPISIPCRVINKTWPQKTELYGEITYKDKTKKEFSLILDGVTKQTPTTQNSVHLPSGGVHKITLFLYNYRETINPGDICGTLIASSTFMPSPSSLAKVTFTIQGSTILSKSVHNLPPKFNDKHPTSITKRA